MLAQNLYPASPIHLAQRNSAWGKNALSRFPVWSLARTKRPLMSAACWHWVASTGSLTQLLTQSADQGFNVKVVNQWIGRIRQDEASLLQQSKREYCWIREVLLQNGNTPWVAARTITPLSSARITQVQKLGNRSLGSWLFQQPDLQRSPIEVTQSSLYQAHCWTRRSLFHHHDITLLVQESFLPAMMRELHL